MISEIRLASERDIPDLCAIWQSAFEDPEDYIKYFYSENFKRILIPVYALDGKPVSMIHLMDAFFSDGEEDFPVRFIYAAATLPAYRSNGFMQTLILDAKRAAEENGYGLFLKPSPRLREFYAGLGFMEDSRFRVFRTAPEKPGTNGAACFPLSAEEYNRMRNSALGARPYVKWPDAHVKWCVDENDFCGGKTLAVELSGDSNRHYLTGYAAKSVLHVTETDLSPGQLRDAASALCGLFGADSMEVLFPEDASFEGETIVSSAVFNAPLRHTYANLLLF